MKDSGDMSMGKLVDILPKDGTPVRLKVDGQMLEASYQGEFGYDEGWGKNGE